VTDGEQRRESYSNRFANRVPQGEHETASCGMKYLPRDAAFGTLQSLVEGARLVRDAG
jgi:hypothetical protein